MSKNKLEPVLKLLFSREYTKAISLLNNLIKQNPDDIDFYRIRAQAFNGVNKTREAILDIKKAIYLAVDEQKVGLKEYLEILERENEYNKNGILEDYCTPLFEAASSGNFEEVQRLVNNGEDIELGKNARNSNKSPLFAAIKIGNLNIVSFLIDNGANIETKVDINFFDEPRYWTPLMSAVQENHFDIIELLLEKGADINFIDNVNWGIVRASLKRIKEKNWEAAEKQALRFIELGAPVTLPAKKVLEEIELFRKNQE